MHSPTKHGRTAKIWRDGQLIPWDDANVHVMSHVVHYGSSIFEGLRFYETPQGPAIFRLEDHMRRLHDSCKIYRMPLRHSVEALIFVARRNVLFTPPLSSGILEGITRDSVMTIARDLGYEVRTEALPRELLYIADEIFFSGTAAEITPVRSVDHVPVGEGRPGPMTRAIQDRFMGIATGKVADKHGWLTVVPAAVAAR